MAFPVDILARVAPGFLEQSAKTYMSKLLCKHSEIPNYLSAPGSKNMEISLCNVNFVPLYGADIKEKILAVFSPEKHLKAVGLYLLDRWWSAEDILKTADSSRTGLIQVRSPGERIVLYVLNRIIYRTEEMVEDDVHFLCHDEDTIAKILWKNGEAIGFYSVKPDVPVRLGNRFLTQPYQLPVMDTIFIRKCHRGHGHGLQMLKDFVNSFKKDFMGLSYSRSPAMFKVQKKYLSLYPEHTELLWEIVGLGSLFQTAIKIQGTDPKGNDQGMGSFYTKDSDIPKKVGIIQVQETMEFTEEEIVQIKTTKDVQGRPVGFLLGVSSGLKRKTLEAEIEETPEKIISRVRDIDPDVQCAEDDSVQEEGKINFHFKKSDLKDKIMTTTHDPGHPISNITHRHYKVQNNLIPEPSHQSREAFEVIVEGQKDKTDLEEMTNKKDGEKVGKILVVENIVDDTEELDVDKEEAGALEMSFIGKDQSEQVKEKNTFEETGMVKESLQETEEQEPSSNNKQEQISTIQQEENSDLSFSSGLKGKGGDKQRLNLKIPSRRAGTLNDHNAESKMSKRPLQCSSKETIKTNSQKIYRQSKSIKQLELLKQVEEPNKNELKQTKSQANLTDEEQPANNDQGLIEVDNKMEYGSQDKETASAEKEAGKTTKNDETVEREKYMIPNDEERVPESAVTDEQNMKEFQKETVTVQEIAGAKTQGVHLFQSSKDDESDRSDVLIKLDEEENNNTSSITPLRCSKRLKNQNAGGKLTKSVLRRSARRSNKATPQRMQLEEPDQKALKNNEMDIMLETEVAVGARMESETVHMFAEGDPENRILFVESTCEEGRNLEKNNLESDDHENIRREGIPEKDKMSSGDIIHGEIEQVCTNISEDESAADSELSEHVKGNVQKEKAATEMVHRENSMERTSTLTLQEASDVLVDVINIHYVTERKDKKETAPVETLGKDSTFIRNDKQDGNIHTVKDVKDNLHEITATLKDKSTSQKLNTNKTQEESQESTAPAQGDSVQASSKDISVCTSRNHRRRTLSVTPTPERKSRCPQNIYNKTKVRKTTQEEMSDEEVETVFTRYLRGRIVTVTPKRKSKRLTVTEKARTAVKEMHGANLKYDTEEIPAVSEALRKDLQQDKDIIGNNSEKVEEVTDERKYMVEKADYCKQIETRDEEIRVEGDLPHEYQEKEESGSYSKKGSDQQDKCLEETLLKKTSERGLHKKLKEKCLEEAKDSAVNILITEAVLDQREEAEGVEKQALRKRSITIESASARRSKRFCRQDEGENDGQTIVWANTDQGKDKKIDGTNTLCGEISHDHKNLKKTEVKKTYRNKNNQENTVTEDMTEFINVAEEDTHTKLEKKVEENREGHSLTEDIMESENNAGKADKVADETEKGFTDAEQMSGVIRVRKLLAASPGRRSSRRSRRLLQDFQSETQDKSETEEVKEGIGGKEKKKV